MKISKHQKYCLIPVIVWAILCLGEWAMWAWPPYGFLFPRGTADPNVQYQTTTQGDLATIYYHVTPVRRKTTYITDRYGARNENNVEEADIVIAGSSFAAGMGSSHEDIPAVQLSNMTDKKVINITGLQDYYGYDNFEAFALWMKHRTPVQAPVFIFMLHDRDLFAAPDRGFDPEAIPKVVGRADWQKNPGLRARFVSLKENIRDYCRWGIFAKKTATFIGHKMNAYRYQQGKMDWPSDVDVIVKDGKVHGIESIASHVQNYRPDNPTLLQYLVRFIRLNQVAGEAGVELVVMLHPSKNTAYNRYSSSKVRIDGFGPAAILHHYLQQAGIKTVFVHPALFEAVDREMDGEGPMVYWSDDTHWAPYGIKIAMFVLARELQKFGLL